ncbi:trehalose-phosphatase [Novosphingobium mangrovi (ex Huang et al. 2023)]|uniref:Trehalose 6-phosphate phosphatase n=1 Tax=Novosphingobium mangrovi (ex Huang et al. 2023) TaxID=2976432 RepID=A0ABT2HZT2_9SPHN|nr:trehalose-phosphatase [Novosphingobium mangrovi (ex Huang et al. 2023)]MCT2398060.1 trehalose-phosphatase [Novosphingobium mangrovi (ex Huang et al. 2023)]
MTDPSDSLSLAEQGAKARDLPQPPPLRISPQTALFLDFDGTLVDIADHPDSVEVAHSLPPLIEALSRQLEGRLALVSGRSLAALDALLGPLDVAMAGSHGGEFRPTIGGEVHPLADPIPADVVDELSRFADANGGLLVEPKPFSVAVHYRHHPHARDGLLACAQDIAARHDLGIKHGKQVVELVMPGSDKGSAVSRFMELGDFTGTAPLFVGDDVTDEDAFRAVGQFGGNGVLVGPLRQTAARWRLESVAAVHEWLASALDGKAHA